MPLDKGFETLALKLQEAATDLSHSDIRTRLSDALNDIYRGTGHYAYVVDVYGDSESGEVKYYCDGDCLSAPYTISSIDGKAAGCEIETENAENVVPRTVYEPEADEGDHMAAMEAIRTNLYSEGTVPLCERFVSKTERDNADSSSFAGKGKSFPILKPGDVMAAVRSIGRAGSDNLSADTIKANIKRIAKAKGWSKYLPKAWQERDAAATEALREAGARHSKSDQEMIQAVHDHAVNLGADCGSTQESSRPVASGDVPIRESMAAFSVGLSESAAPTEYPIKLIDAGWGTSGYYPAQMLERDGPGAFPAGTQMFWDHATDAEESARPEGRMDDLAAVTTESARWDSQGKDGPGLYAKARVFADYAGKVAEKAKYTGLSIRAFGKAKDGEAEGRRGLIIEGLTRGKSIDFVAAAGRGGKVLMESARTAETTPTQEAAGDMTAEEQRKFEERFQKLEAENRKLKERAAISEAPATVAKYFDGVHVAEGIRARVTKRVLSGNIPLTEAGDLDSAKLTSLVEAETKDEAAYIDQLSGGRFVTGMATSTAQAQQPAQLTEAQRKAEEERVDQEQREAAIMAGFDVDVHKQGIRVLEGGRGNFNPLYNSRAARGAKPTMDVHSTLEVTA